MSELSEADDAPELADQGDETSEPGAPAQRPPGFLWDVMDEHLEEAAYKVTRFFQVLESPELTLDDLARHPEQSLLAHVDALVLGDAPVREHLIAPALAEASPEDPDRITALTWILIESGRFADTEAALGHEAPEIRAAAARAGHLASHPGLHAWLHERVEARPSDRLRAGLLMLGATRQLLLQPVLDALQSDDPQLVLAAAQAARFGEAARYLPVMEYLLDHESLTVREAALLASLTWGSQQAFWKARKWALDPKQPVPLATLLLAVLGTQEEQRELARLLPEPSTRNAILFALGFSGDAGLAPVLFTHLESTDPVEARVAAQSLGIIFGFLPSEQPYAVPPPPPREAEDDEDDEDDELPPPEEDAEAQASLPPLSDQELEADLVPAPEEALPLPNVEAVRAHCQPRIQTLAEARALYGQPYSAQGVVELLPHCPLRWRHALALGLFVRSTGAAWLDTRATTRAQKNQHAALTPRALLRFSAW
jgi:uncharacterized protein (TIGR02270 family)